MNLYDGALWLSGYVGQVVDDEFFTQSQVRQAIAKHGDRPLTVYINSGGGFVHEGIAIYNLLKAHPKAITVVVDGMAASIASAIAMAGDEIVIRRGSQMMIHDPSVSMSGTAKEFEQSAETLHLMADELAAIYAARTKRPASEIRALMVAETWFSPDQAVKAGLADRVDSMGARVAASFPYSKVYAHAPQSLRAAAGKATLQRIVDQNNKRRGLGQTASPAADTVFKSGSTASTGGKLLASLISRVNARR